MSEFGTAYGGAVTPEQLKTGAGYTLQTGPLDLALTAGTMFEIGTPANANNTPFCAQVVRIVGRGIEGINTPPVVSIGTNHPDYNNILESATLTDIANNGTFLQEVPFTSQAVPPGTPISFIIETPADALSFTVDASVQGVHMQPAT